MVNHQTRIRPLTGNIWRISDNPKESTYKHSNERQNPTLNEWFAANEKNGLQNAKPSKKTKRNTNSNIISANNDPTNSLAGGNKRTTLAWIRPTSEIGEKKVRNWPESNLTYVKIHSTKLHTYLNVWRSADTGQRERTWKTKHPNPNPTILSLIDMHAKLHTSLSNKITNYLYWSPMV